MVPTLILAGLVVGRWWLVPVAAVVWPIVLAGSGVWDVSAPALVIGGGTVGALNTAAGVAVRRLVLAVVRALRRFLADPIGTVGGGG